MAVHIEKTAFAARAAAAARLAFACVLGAALALCLTCAFAPWAHAAGRSYTFDISQGPIIIDDGSTVETLSVWTANPGLQDPDLLILQNRTLVLGAPNFTLQQDLILPDDTIVITGASTQDFIAVKSARRAHIVIDKLSINRSLNEDKCAFFLCDRANVTLSLSGENSLISGPSYAGIRVPLTASLEILGDGSFINRPNKAEKDIVLIVDVSGSMYGDRISKTKEAAIQFCTTVLNGRNDTRISFVTSSDTATVKIESSSDIDALTNAINSISAVGGNEDPFGLPTAKKLLSKTANQGIVILLSDGVPHHPQVVSDTAKELMQQYDMYTIGVSPPAAGKDLLRECQNRGYYDITDLSNLQTVFNDIGNAITGGSDTLTAISASPAAGVQIGGAGIGGNDGESAGSITIRGAGVTAYSGGCGAGIGGGRGGAGGRFLLDGGVVNACSALLDDAYGAGIGGGQGGAGGSVAIKDGYLFACSAANGKGYGAGIGSGAGGANGGNIAIVHAQELEAYSAKADGDGYGAGIGGGFQSPCGTVVITEYTNITAASAASAAGGTGRGADIGAGEGSGNHGNQLILTNSAGGDYLIGQVVLPASIERYTVSALDRLILPAGSSLTVPAGVTLVNDGIIENYGSLNNNATLVNNGRIDNFAVLRNNGQFIRNPGSFFNGDPSVPAANDVSYFDRAASWYTPGGSSSRSFPAANGKVWVDYSLSGTAATLHLTPQKAEEIVRNSEDGTADFDFTGTNVTEWSFPKAAFGYFADKNLAVEFKTPTGAVRLDRTAVTDLADQGGGEQFHLLLRRADAYALSLAQRSALRADEAVYELTAAVDGQKLRSFNGFITVVVPYSGILPGGAWRLDENRARVAAPVVCENGVLRFTTNRFAFFAVGRGGSPATDTNTPWYYIR
ncbi:MAG: VWA domain-containing protein [Clostridiales Family XIII bacterium]|jgi:hypothetical protein|nr:VWA domain-containing protein [Clostridiales Family XIII bacterium]